MSIIVRLPKNIVIQSDSEVFEEPLATYVTMIRSYITNLYSYGVHPKTIGNTSTAELVNDASRDFKLKHFLMVIEVGGNIENYSPYIKIAEADINNEVPEGLPLRTYPKVDDTDPENPITTEHVHTWLTWNDYYTKTLVDGYYYFLAMRPDKKYLTGEELLLIYNSDDATLIDKIPVTDE